MSTDQVAMWFLFTIGIVTPQLIIMGLLAGHWIRKYPEWKEI